MVRRPRLGILLALSVMFFAACPLFDSQSPIVNITEPANGSTVSGAVTVSVVASDDTALQKVQLFIDGELQAEDTGPPFAFDWDTTAFPDGAHDLKAVAIDQAGNLGTDDDTAVTVDNSSETIDTTLPTVNITSPADGDTVAGNVTISADASDNVEVASVRFFIGGDHVGTDTSVPYTHVWDTTAGADGAFSLRAVAIDSSGNSAEDDDTTVTVANAGGAATWDNVTWDNFDWQ